MLVIITEDVTEITVTPVAIGGLVLAVMEEVSIRVVVVLVVAAVVVVGIAAVEVAKVEVITSTKLKQQSMFMCVRLA